MTITITLKKPEIDYDIAMTTHVVMNRELAAGASQEQGFNYANTQDESGEVHLITRFTEKAITEVASALARHLHDYKYESDNDLPSFVGVTFILSMPDNFDKTMTDRLRSAIHDYIVNKTIYEWYMRTKPDEAAIYRDLSEASKDDIRSALNARVGGIRIKPWPAI